jgi:hypothetical protein
MSINTEENQLKAKISFVSKKKEDTIDLSKSYSPVLIRVYVFLPEQAQHLKS